MNRDELRHLESGRWEILRATRVAGHVGVSETMLYHALVSMWVSTTRAWIRDQLHYLESRGLVECERREVGDWRAVLTRYGDDIVNYIVDCEPGIARPSKYWGDEA